MKMKRGFHLKNRMVMFQFKILMALFFFGSFYVMALEKGMYQCVKGNQSSICPQKIFPVYDHETLVALKVYYSGDCGDQGPYRYQCQDNQCGGYPVVFNLTSDTTYEWSNVTYDFHCDFEKMSND